MLARLRELAESGKDFAFETTLSTRSFVPQLLKMRENGYEFTLFFLWLADSELAVLRVAERVRQGGYNIPEETIKRRYEKSLNNFFRLYQPIADNWFFFDNSKELRLIAKGNLLEAKEIFNEKLWREMNEKYG